MMFRQANRRRTFNICDIRSTFFVTILATLLFFTSLANAQIRDKASFRDSYQIDPLGNAKITRILRLPPKSFAQIQQTTGDPVQVMQSVSSHINWHELKVIGSRFDAKTKSVVVDLEQKGFARTIGEGRWEMKSRSKPGALELVTCQNDRVVLHGAEVTDIGLVSATILVLIPNNAKAVTFDSKKAALRYELDPVADDAESKEVDQSKIDQWSFESSPQLMACLAKVYGNEAFDSLWTARSVFRNTNPTTIRDFRVRFKVDGLSSWGQWHRSPVVYPNQTVVDGYFPVLDIDKLAKLNGRSKTTVTAEFRYIDSEQNDVTDTKSTQIEVLPPNEVAFQRDPSEDPLGWYDQNELAPLVVASFCWYNDSVIQQLAGRICGMANGPASSLSNRDAARYLLATHKFMQDNNFRFAPSSSLFKKLRFDTSIQFPRNFLQSRSGNEVDLAVFWASVAKAVGLKSEIVLSSRSAFAVIYLPSGQEIPIAGTDLKKTTLDDAVRLGQLRLQESLKKSRFVININEMEKMGIRPLELERIGDDYFSQKAFEFSPMPELKSKPEKE